MVDKRKYEKPLFVIHQIPLVQGGGTGCAYSALSTTACGVYDPDLGQTLFVDMSVCTLYADPGEMCYTVPISDQNIYSS